jgi:hypothetical protein
VFDIPYCRGVNTETLKQQRSIWEGDWEVVKRSGRDESIMVVIHLCMEAMLGTLCIAILKSTGKNSLSFLLLLMSSLQQNWRKWQNRFCMEVRGWMGEGGNEGRGWRNSPNNVCTYEYMNKGNNC